MVMVGLIKKVKFEKKIKLHMENVMERGNSQCKGLEAENFLVC